MTLVPDGFAVPAVVVAEPFRLELLGPVHNEPDHDAWMSSIAHIRATPGFDRGWPPPDGMTLAANLADLENHADRSARRVDFAYSVLDAATGEVVGCVYLTPTGGPGEVKVASWVRASRAELDGPLVETVTAWLDRSWPFTAVHYR